jgi:hypothetical protein
MSSQAAVHRHGRWLPWLSRLCLVLLAGPGLLLTAAAPAAAGTDLCGDPLLQSASVQSSLHVRVRGQDWASMTSVMRITLPEAWRGTGGLLGDPAQQSAPIGCFLPFGQEEYRQGAPRIAVIRAKPPCRPCVQIVDTVTETDSFDRGSAWDMGIWHVARQPWGYSASFTPQEVGVGVIHGHWTVTLDAPGFRVQGTAQEPLPSPATDDGHGKLTWSFPKDQLLPDINAELRGAWPVRMNLATQRWPMRWLSDALWAVTDGALLYGIALWLAWRLWRRRPGNPGQRRLAGAAASISLLGLGCYAGYVIDDYFWNSPNGDAVWIAEDLTLVAIAAFFFVTGCGIRCRWAAAIAALAASAAALTAFGGAIVIGSWAPISFYARASTSAGNVTGLLILTVPLQFAMTLMIAGTALWIGRLWPFGKAARTYWLRDWRGQPSLEGSHDQGAPCRSAHVAVLLLASFIVSAVILGLGATSSYDVWLHRHSWVSAANLDGFQWVSSDLLQETHWWISDGLQWALFFTVTVAVFAVLRAMSTDARGVFFEPRRDPADTHVKPTAPKTAGSAIVLVIVFAGWFIGSWGFYSGISVPLAFLIAAAGLSRFGLKKDLSDLDGTSKVVGRTPNELPSEHTSLLVTHRTALFAAAERAAAAALARKQGVTPPASGSESDSRTPGPAPDEQPAPRQQAIQLEPATQPPRRGWAQRIRRRQPAGAAELVLPEAIDAGAVALALGPGDTWWDNGKQAVRTGALLTVVPLGFYAYITWRNGGLAPLTYPFGLLDILSTAASVLIAWLVGLFAFGALLPYLRGTRAPFKGVVLGVVTLAAEATDAAIRHALGVTPYSTFLVDGLLAIAVFGTLGLLLDMRTLQIHNRDSGLLNTLYRLGHMRVAVTFATTLLVVGIGIWQDVYLTGQTAQQRAQTASDTAQAVSSTITGKK